MIDIVILMHLGIEGVTASTHHVIPAHVIVEDGNPHLLPQGFAMNEYGRIRSVEAARHDLEVYRYRIVEVLLNMSKSLKSEWEVGNGIHWSEDRRTGNTKMILVNLYGKNCSTIL